MPVVTLTASDHPAVGDLLREVADAIEGSLSLGAGGVIARAIVASPGVASNLNDDPGEWPIVSIHGSDRGVAATTAARDAANAAVRAWGVTQGIEIEGVWTEWIVPQLAR